MGAKKNTALSAPAGEGLQKAENAHHVGATAHLHGGPDLAVGIQQERERHEKRNKDQKALTKDQKYDPEVGGREEFNHCPVLYSAAILPPACALA